MKNDVISKHRADDEKGVFLLSVKNHDRDAVQLTYVYPVISRRAGGVSLGINLNPNNMCNWQCVYCQVPNLKRGVGTTVDLQLLETELDGFLTELLHGDYMVQHVPEACRELRDLAISGNGEPTTCPNFEAVVLLIKQLMIKHQLNIPLRLITNGSSVHKVGVQAGLVTMALLHGEIWFKVDVIGEKATRAMNGVSLSPEWQMNQLEHASTACPTWLQTCVLKEQSEDAEYMGSYLRWLKSTLARGIKIEGVLLYSLARPSMQENGDLLEQAEHDWMQDFAQKIESLGLVVKVS
ncbi:MAG: radical SAM protein [Ghiorsea sp.]